MLRQGGLVRVAQERWRYLTPAAENHGLWPWMNTPTFGGDVAPQGR